MDAVKCLTKHRIPRPHPTRKNHPAQNIENHRSWEALLWPDGQNMGVLLQNEDGGQWDRRTTCNFCWSHIHWGSHDWRGLNDIFSQVDLSPAGIKALSPWGLEDYQELAHKTGRICVWTALKSHPLGGPPRARPPGRLEPMSLPGSQDPTGGIQFTASPCSISPSGRFSLW